MCAENKSQNTENQTRVLLIEDDSGYARLIQEMLRHENNDNLAIIHSACLMDGFKVLAEIEIDVILLDLTLPDSSGIDTFLRIRGVVPEIPVVVLTAIDDETLAVTSVQKGAQDYLFKAEVRPRLLVRTLRYAVQRKQAAMDLKRAHDQLEVKVKERTTQLAEVNNQLQEEIDERKRIEEALRKNEELYRATIESTADGIFVVNENGEVTHVNARFRELLTIPEDILVEKNDEKLLKYLIDKLENPADFLSKVDGMYQTSKDSFDILTFKDGRVFERYTCPLVRNKQYAGRVWSFREVTDQKKVDENLRKIERSFGTITDKSSDIICEMDKNGIVTYISQAAERIIGTKPRSIIGTPMIDCVSDSGKAMMQKHIDKVLAGEHVDGLQIEIKGAKGAPVLVEINLSPVFHEKEISGALGIARDISKRNALNEKHWLFSMTDPLTGLFNQRQLSKIIDEEVKRAKRIPYPLSLSLFNLDGFNAYNETNGRLKGDEVLMEVGRIIKRLIRKDTDIAFRYGGDEFAIILPNAAKKDALTISNRIVEKITRRLGYPGMRIGVASLEDTMTAEDLIESAMDTMNKQKEMGTQKIVMQQKPKADEGHIVIRGRG